MVTIVDYRLNKNSDGEEFVSLILEGNLTMIRSKETGSWYATSKRASITSTFDEVKANKLIGRELPGSIIREECPPYLYTIPESGEEIELSHTNKYVPDPKVEEKVAVEEEEIFA
jgi:hypothetical protein